ncbi:LysE family translocator [Falsibacillus pallidus]|uniref:LysE family translocator n=1 Tax=Falsibacillus pallidus TaxID=493781 RepID=UPI003D96EC9A
MDIWILIKGLLIGLSIAAPVGPIGVLCIRNTLMHGKKSGFITGMGAAFADGVYGLIAGFGLTGISRFLMGYQDPIHLIGGVFLLYLGVRTYFSQPANAPAILPEKAGWTAFLSVFLLTLSNPMTILSFLAIFAGIGGQKPGISSSLQLVFGVFFGSILWWFILSSGVNLAKSKMTPAILLRINRLSGGIIAAFAIWTLASLISS